MAQVCGWTTCSLELRNKEIKLVIFAVLIGVASGAEITHLPCID